MNHESNDAGGKQLEILDIINTYSSLCIAKSFTCGIVGWLPNPESCHIWISMSTLKLW